MKGRNEQWLLDAKHISDLVEKLKDVLYQCTTEEKGTGSGATTGITLPKLFYVDRDARAHASRMMKSFHKKDEARDYARAHGNLPMWSIDKFNSGDKAGAKYFVVASYDEFFDAYGPTRLERPVFGRPTYALDTYADDKELPIYPFAYEVIMEGVPLHLYLDMEGSRETNQGVNFGELAKEILYELRTFMCDLHIAPKELIKKSTVVSLDSSTSAKFSKHVVYKIPGCVFENNYVCGALMRNFHLHLLSKYGPEESNKFYVNPPSVAKSATKICMLDFAVYTKFRDFRLIGSCKRKGCADPKTRLRWLWKEGKRGVLTKEDFLDCLIQRTHISNDIIGANIVDTINNGIPYSSSLRTARPLNPSSSGGGHSNNPTVHGPSSDFSRTADVALSLPVAMKKRLEALGQNIGQYLTSSKDFAFRPYFRDGAKIVKTVLRTLRDGNFAWNIETTSSYCVVRKEKMGDPMHKPGGRKSTFLVWATGLCKDGVYDERKVGVIKQLCIANSCTSGIGPAKPAWSGYIGCGLSVELRKTINEMLRPCIQEEITRLGLTSANNKDFDIEPETKKIKMDDAEVCLFDDE
jgi:hypothetical protein